MLNVTSYGRKESNEMKNGKESRFKSIILKNFTLKILAVILAVALWVVIVNIDNPSRTTTISGIQVVLQNEEELINKGYTYAIQSGAVLSITVKAPQTIVENLEATDFYAYADLSELSPTSDKTPIKIKCQKSEVANQVDIVSLKTEYVQLSIDNKLTKDVMIQAEYVGNPASGYVAGECHVSPTTVTVTGAESVVNRIKTAKIVYNISNMTQSISEDAKIVFYDKDGNEVKSDLLSLSRNTAKINIEIDPTKRVNINYAVTGSPAEGYVISEISGSLEKVTIAANKQILDKISSIDIPSEYIKTDGISEDTVIEIPLAVFLPSGSRIVSEEKTLKLTLTVRREMKIEIPYDKINLSGCSNVYEYEIVGNTDNLEVIVVGNKEDVEKLTADDFYLSASMAGKKIGSHNVRVSFEDNELYSVTGNYEIEVEITEKKEPETETPSGEDETDSEQETSVSNEIGTETESK